MIDLYLRTATEKELADACPFLQTTNDDGEIVWIKSGNGFDLDLIGTIAIQPTYDAEGNELTPIKILDGFHANLRCAEEIASMVPDDLKIEVSNPQRVWA